MNFGDRLKQLRTRKNLTQPQLAQAIGIEQSYLSKLENDKSVPGADIFQAILRAFEMDVASFLAGVDDNIVHRELRQVPEVANHLNSQVALRVHNVKKWLFSSAIAGVLGLTLFGAGYKQLLTSNWQYTYRSDGVVHPDEPSEIFERFNGWIRVKLAAGEIDAAEAKKRESELWSRMKLDFRTLRENRGDAFIEQVPGGSRVYNLRDRDYQEQPANRYLMLAGLLLTFASLFGFIVEMRLRTLKRT
ncbi:MAG TPA: helix-turn-helix transcriptional regulator [Steroidobacteraceae bacterium]|nr:helix-turn-helix transcriptional regulator [Steroidobacteraceae bacterium]